MERRVLKLGGRSYGDSMEEVMGWHGRSGMEGVGRYGRDGRNGWNGWNSVQRYEFSLMLQKLGV